ncbi:hypothetical protein EZV62_007610 [Acer yangbiense]|uniref:RNase H type-1 domain-containing protein n=1 Tax=Acer yangbiense TaxID=1000413 RepID=A0A5C7IAR8_9ROSI|nr:hypothetical protein EZV62_007610 [Acer yangbiense]
MVKKAARKCSHCGHYGHNSRTCNGGKSFKLFGVNIENSGKGSMSMENMQEMVKEAARKCSHCGHYGHNSRTCNGGKSFKLFSANIENSRKGSMSRENMQSVVDVHVETGSPSDGKRDKAVRIAWTEKEHNDFLAGLNMLGKGDWKGISSKVVQNPLPSCSSVSTVSNWLPPAPNLFKINCRVVTDFVNRRTGLGIIIRNHGGIVLASCSLFQESGMDFMSANSVAILKGFQFGKHCGLLPFCVESDAANVVSLINLGGHSNSACGNIVSDILEIMKELGFSFILAGKKGSNKPAIALARQALLRKSDLIWRRHCC